MKNRILFTFLILLVFIFSFSLVATSAFAQQQAVPKVDSSAKDKDSPAPEDPVKAGGYGLEETTKETSISKDNIGVFIGTIIKYVFAILGSVLVALIIYGGVLYMTAAGNEKRVETAKTTLTYAVIGITICLTGFVLTSYILGVLTGDTGFLEKSSDSTISSPIASPSPDTSLDDIFKPSDTDWNKWYKERMANCNGNKECEELITDFYENAKSSTSPTPPATFNPSYLGTQAVMEYNDYKHLYFSCGKEGGGCINDYQDICCNGYKCDDTSKKDYDPTNGKWFGYCVKE